MNENPGDTTNSTPVSSLDPTGRTMEQTVEPTEDSAPKSKKTGIIIGIIAGVLVLVGVITAAVVAMMGAKPSDPVEAAMQKILRGEASKNVAIDGNIEILANNPSSPVKSITIDLDSDTVVGLMVNKTSAKLTLTDRSDKEYTANFEELYGADGDLYFKLSGVANLLDDQKLLDLFMGSASSSPTSTTPFNNAMLEQIFETIKDVDGLWLRLSLDDFSMLTGGMVGTNNSISCVTDLVSGFNNNSNSAAAAYNKNPFLTSSDKNIPVSQKQYPVHEIVFDSTNLASYVNAIQNTEFAKSLYSCMGWSNVSKTNVTEADVNQILSTLPKLYTEVDENSNFTRIYTEINTGEMVDCGCPEDAECIIEDCSSYTSTSGASVKMDFDISYPTNVNVYEPEEYKDFESIIQQILKNDIIEE